MVGGPSHTHPRPSTAILIWGTDPIHVNIGGTSYIPSHVPSSSTLVPSNAFLTTHPRPNSHGPLGLISTISHVNDTILKWIHVIHVRDPILHHKLLVSLHAETDYLIALLFHH